MENSQNSYRINPAIIFAVILQLIFVIFAGITIRNLLERKIEVPGIKISNYSAIPDGEIIKGVNQSSKAKNINFNLNDAAKNTIEGAIYNIASDNSNTTIANSGAKIREGSAHYVYIEDLDIYFLNFIVDVEDLEQSYRFTGHWADSTSVRTSPEYMSITTLCLGEDELIYDNFDCKDSYNGQGLGTVIYGLLRYKPFNNFTVGISGDIFSDDTLFHINTTSDEEDVKNAAVAELSEYLSSLGFDLDKFQYDVGAIEIAN